MPLLKVQQLIVKSCRLAICLAIGSCVCFLSSAPAGVQPFIPDIPPRAPFIRISTPNATGDVTITGLAGMMVVSAAHSSHLQSILIKADPLAIARQPF